MKMHFLVLVVGSIIFALLFVLQTRFIPHAGSEAAIMVLGIALRNALRAAFLYLVFAVLVFGHYVFGCCAKQA